MSAPPLDRNAVRIAATVLVGGVTVILDSTIVSVALHELSTDLDTDVSTIQWVSTGYLLALGTVIPMVGWLQSRVGAKRLWMGSLALFFLGSVLCSAAWDVSSLIAFRVVQGVGGGAMIPLMTTMIMQATRGPDRARLMSVVAMPAAVCPIIGPVIGGLILGAASWRWLFLVNVPLCVLGLLLAWRMIPNDKPSGRVRLDVTGLVLLSPALVALLWGLSNVSGENGFAQVDVVVPLVAGALLLGGFVAWALRRKGAALVDLDVLRSRPTWSATVLLFLSGASLYGAMLLLPLYWQELRGEDALGAGLLLIPQGVGSLLSRTVAVRLMERISARGVSILGFVLVGVGTVPFAFADSRTAIWTLMAALFVRGLGLGMAMIPLMTVAFVGLEHEQVPHASIVTRVAQQVGGSVGVALLAVILATSTSGTTSRADAFDHAFWWTLGFTGVAVLLSFALPGRDAVGSGRAHGDRLMQRVGEKV
ncbi:MDR family MFS transporter [Luteipulveratus mongoliensis]|uniref:MDR family MFS transporter n=1 Tax=Luteipulveratus mongoliensis TaxID=571913 RepID=UPI0009F9168C|nr:MDR family MFS transporter [Luteipulveratus mongoliensis]